MYLTIFYILGQCDFITLLTASAWWWW